MIDHGTSQLAGGFAASCGVLLMLAGVSKEYRAARGFDGDTAIRRALRIPRPRWRRVERVAGGLEVATGVAVCAGASPLPGHAAAAAVGGGVMAGLGAAFCVLLGYARAKRLTGGCGCIEWRPSAVAKAQPVSWREIARSAVLLAAGVAAAVLHPGAGGFRPAWFGAGLLAGRRRHDRAEPEPPAAHARLPPPALAPGPRHAAGTGRARGIRGHGRRGRAVRAGGEIPP